MSWPSEAGECLDGLDQRARGWDITIRRQGEKFSLYSQRYGLWYDVSKLGSVFFSWVTSRAVGMVSEFHGQHKVAALAIGSPRIAAHGNMTAQGPIGDMHWYPRPWVMGAAYS